MFWLKQIICKFQVHPPLNWSVNHDRHWMLASLLQCPRVTFLLKQPLSAFLRLIIFNLWIFVYRGEATLAESNWGWRRRCVEALGPASTHQPLTAIWATKAGWEEAGRGRGRRERESGSTGGWCLELGEERKPWDHEAGRGRETKRGQSCLSATSPVLCPPLSPSRHNKLHDDKLTGWSIFNGL